MPDRTLAAFARRCVKRRLERMRKASAAMAGGDPAELHALRIAAKRLRYNLEFFGAIAHADLSPALDALARLQDRLGAVADADTFEATYAALLAPLDATDTRRAGFDTLRALARTDRERALAGARELWAGGALFESIAAAARAGFGRRNRQLVQNESEAAPSSSAPGSGSPKPEP